MAKLCLVGESWERSWFGVEKGGSKEVLLAIKRGSVGYRIEVINEFGVYTTSVGKGICARASMDGDK